MTQEEIIKLAQEAGFENYAYEAVGIFERFARLVSAAEREKFTNTQEFITLRREVVEQALESMLNEGNFRKLRKPLIEESIKQIKTALEQAQEICALADISRDAQEAPFEAWWEKHGQFLRTGGGQCQKTFAWHAWCEAAKKSQLQVEHPVAWGSGEGFWIQHVDKQYRPDYARYNIPFYTRPQPKREPLTHQQIDAIAESMPGGMDGFLKGWGWRQFSRAIEAAHNIK